MFKMFFCSISTGLYLCWPLWTACIGHIMLLLVTFLHGRNFVVKPFAVLISDVSGVCGEKSKWEWKEHIFIIMLHCDILCAWSVCWSTCMCVTARKVVCCRSECFPLCIFSSFLDFIRIPVICDLH